MKINDGGDHFFTVIAEEENDFSVEAVHRYSQQVEKVIRSYNKCLFEELVHLHILEKANFTL